MLHLASDNLGLLQVGAAAVLDVQDHVLLGHVLVAHDILIVQGAQGADGHGLLLGVDGGDVGQSLLHGQDVINLTVAVVVDDGQGSALHVGGLVAILLGGVGDVLAGVVVPEILGVLVGQAVLAQQLVIVHLGVLRAAVEHGLAGGDDSVHVGDHGVAVHGGVSQDSGLLDIQVDGLAQHVNGSADIEGLGLEGGVLLAHGGVAGGGEDALAVVDGGLALLQGGVAVIGSQGSPLVGHNNALHLDHAVLVGQDGAVVAVSDGVVVGGVALDHLHVQGVVDQQGRVIPVQGSGQILGEALEDALLVGADGHVDGPVGTLKALDSGVVAHGHQQHLGRLQGGHGGAGIKGAGAAAGNDAGGVAVVDVALGPVAGDIGQAGVDALVQSAVVHALVHDDGEHLRHLSAVNIFGRTIGAVGLALDDAEGNQHGNGVLVHDLILIGEIVVAHSGGGDNHHADEHDRRQSQAESPLEVSHLDFLLLNFEPEGRMTPLTGEETMQISGDRDIKGGETESKGCYGRRLVDNTGAGKVKTPWNPKGSKAFLVDFW